MEPSAVSHSRCVKNMAELRYFLRQRKGWKKFIINNGSGQTFTINRDHKDYGFSDRGKQYYIAEWPTFTAEYNDSLVRFTHQKFKQITAFTKDKNFTSHVDGTLSLIFAVEQYLDLFKE